MSARTPIALAVAVLAGAAAVRAADSPSAAFKKHWEGRRLAVQRTLFTLVFDELGRMGTHRGRREGLTVATPSSGTFYVFAGRQSRDDLAADDPDRLVDAIKASYHRGERHGIGTVQTITPLHLVQYPRGVALVVRRVELDRAAVRLTLHKPEPPGEFATTLAVQWPAPLSSGLLERAEIERVIGQYLVPAP